MSKNRSLGVVLIIRSLGVVLIILGILVIN